jgi:hypothetical protein
LRTPISTNAQHRHGSAWRKHTDSSHRISQDQLVRRITSDKPSSGSDLRFGMSRRIHPYLAFPCDAGHAAITQHDFSTRTLEYSATEKHLKAELERLGRSDSSAICVIYSVKLPKPARSLSDNRIREQNGRMIPCYLGVFSGYGGVEALPSSPPRKCRRPQLCTSLVRTGGSPWLLSNETYQMLEAIILGRTGFWLDTSISNTIWMFLVCHPLGAVRANSFKAAPSSRNSPAASVPN